MLDWSDSTELMAGAYVILNEIPLSLILDNWSKSGKSALNYKTWKLNKWYKGHFVVIGIVKYVKRFSTGSIKDQSNYQNSGSLQTDF